MECMKCGNDRQKFQRHHHPIPKRLGGQDTRLVCSECHRKLEAKIRRCEQDIRGREQLTLLAFPVDQEEQEIREALERQINYQNAALF